MTLLHRSLGSHNGCAEVKRYGSHNDIVDLEGSRVSVHSVATENLDIERRHRLGHILPAAEGVTLLVRSSGSIHSLIVGNLYLSNNHIVYLEGSLIDIYGVSAVDCDVVCGHHLGHILPAGESMTLLDGSLRCHYGCAYLYGERCDYILTDHEGCGVSGHRYRIVGILGIRTGDHDILCGHRSGYILPAIEHMVFLGRSGRCRDHCAVVYGECSHNFVVDHEGGGVSLHIICAYDLYVECRHRLGHILPASEYVALLGRGLGSNYSLVVGHFESSHYLAVDAEGSLVGIHGV